jgi:protein-serine/threonine kinase
MTTATTLRLPPVQTTFNSVSHDKPASHIQFESQTDSQPTSKNTSLTSSPESRPVDLRSPIPEEEEDETSSEAANEPVTPTDTQHPHNFHHKTHGGMNLDGAHTLGSIHNPPPLLLNTSATPPSTSASREVGTPVIDQDPPKTPLQRRPTSSSKDSGIKRAVSGFFRRSNSHSANLHPLTPSDHEALTNGNGSDPMLSREHRRLSIRRMSATTSLNTTRSNTPPSPGTPVDNGQPQTQTQLHGPSAEEFFNNKKNRSSTGFNFRDKIHKHKISFATHEKEPKHNRHRHRATSVDLHDGPQNQDQSTQNHQLMDIKRQVWGMPAEAGIGLKSRRMSLSLPDDFTVDVVELYTEYADQSRMVGRRGKSVGKGTTANVRLMNRKGGCAGEVYAVKEFRGKSSNEKSEDYEKKVKSEFSIAKSLHHPNIVETFRLCAHQGRWNHVMEFCDQGDLFKLVDQKYLYQEQHLSDRLCLFKQLIQGVHYLHSNGIAHRDIKLENLLITKESKLKITDFGVSEVFSGIHPGLRAAGGQCGKEMGEVRLCAPGVCGSEPYIAPEVLQKQGMLDLDMLFV